MIYFVPNRSGVTPGKSLLRLSVGMVLMIGFTILEPNMLEAQPESDAPAEIAPIEALHTPIAGSEIPPVGSLMKIRVTLARTLDIESKVRLVGAKDGRFIDIAFPRGALDNSNKPSFTVEIPSPIAMMAYQFIVHQKDGTLTSSRRFVVKRPCIQNFAVSVQDDKRTTAFRREVASLIAQAHMLERDNKSLESSLKLLEEIKASLAR